MAVTLVYPFHSQATTSNVAAVKKAYLANPISAHQLQMSAARDECSRFQSSVECAYWIFLASVQRRQVRQKQSQVQQDIFRYLDILKCKVRDSIDHTSTWYRAWAIVYDQVINPRALDPFRASIDMYLDTLMDLQLAVREWKELVQRISELMKKELGGSEVRGEEVNGDHSDMKNRLRGDILSWAAFLDGVGCRRLAGMDEGLRAWVKEDRKAWEDEQILTKLVPVSGTE